MVDQYSDPKDQYPEETREWLESLEAVIDREGAERAHFLLDKLVELARRSGAHLPFDLTTAYVNTIPPAREPNMPGDGALERRIRSIIRWNAMAMVVRAARRGGELGGHIASFASAATLYDVGFNHFFKGPNHPDGSDLVYIQGHSSPGIYARAFLEGRLSKEQLDGFRQEVDGAGLSSYPHPWLMPDFWQLPTVSMGLGPIMAIYQARFLKYLTNRELTDASKRKVWCFMGDGECDEPESLGAISLAGREKLDNLIFVVNCNLRRLDGPVRGTGKIIQDLEGVFRGAGWNVIKVIWGSYWDPLLARDTKGLLRKRMEEAIDGEYQKYKAMDGGYVRDHFFGAYDELKEMVADMSDEDIWRLNRGGHDPYKIHAAYHAATHHEGAPTVILAKTIKGYGLGQSGEGMNISHQQKKLDDEGVKYFRDRFNVPVPDEDLAASSAASCPSAPARHRNSRFPNSRPSRPCSRAPATARSPPPWPSSGSWPCCCATRTSRTTSCRSSATRAGPSAWKACSARSASTRRSASSTSRSIRTSSRSTRKTRRARCCRKASPRPAR